MRPGHDERRRPGLGAALLLSTLLLPGASSAQTTLTATASFAGRTSVGSDEPIELVLNRPVGPSDGRFAVFMREMDVTPLFKLDGTTLRFTPGAIKLPAGQSRLILYLFAQDETWVEVAAFDIRIEEPPAAETVAAPTGEPPAQAARSWTANLVPTVSLNVAHQSTVDFFPESNRPSRESFTDFSLQAGVQAGLTRGPYNAQSQVDLVGASFEQQALRFGEMGEGAPRIDLSSWQAQVDLRKLKVQVGHTSYGSHRYLISSFSSRGLTVAVPIAGRADVSFSAMNGTSIVGWSNFTGLSRKKHRVVSGTVGVELLPDRPGGARVEISALNGSLLPVSNYNQSNLNDAETSRGFGARIMASDNAQRMRLEAGIARSRFNNPTDPLLGQGFSTVTVKADTGIAHYLDFSYQLVKDRRIAEQWMAALTMSLRYSRVDPLYKSVAVYAQADRFDLQYEVSGNIGEIMVTGGYNRANDNLANISSLLKTLTRRSNVNVTFPLKSLVGASTSTNPAFPRLGYSADRTHQYGDGIPENGGFDASSVPDQISLNQNFTADWQLSKFRAGYRLNHSFVDNRQPGRAASDLKNLVNAVSVGVQPHSKLDLTFELSSERSHNFETGARYHIYRSTFGASAQTTTRSTLSLTLGTTFEGDVGDANESRNIDLDAQWSAGFSKQKDRYRKIDVQFFIRYARRYAHSIDNVFFLENLTRLQTFNTGLRITFF